ncbi:MAG: hypothetical protein KGM43_03740 [Planctomycetota bacterium]|nr:hypothetical protein [Planctomycetota bacterium]
MSERIHQSLRPVRLRLAWIRAARGAAYGLLAASIVGMGLGAARFVLGRDLPLSWVAMLGLLPVAGALASIFRGWGWKRAAAAVDVHYRLKDRVVTALDFLHKDRDEPLRALQIVDAEVHLSVIKPAEVAPARMPRVLPYALATSGLAAALLAWPLANKPVAAGPSAPIPEIVAEAYKIGEDLEQLDELAKSDRDIELQKLVDELRAKVEEMKKPGVDEREALAKLSEMQAKIASQQAQYNVGLVDGQLQAMGAAMTPAESLEAAGNALAEAKFDKAAEKLELLEEPELDRKEAKAVAEKMKQVAESMGEAGLGQLAEAAGELADGLSGDGKGKFKKATKTLAKLVKGHARRRKIKEILDAELAQLDESKGECKSNKAYRIRMPQKSNSPKSDWGAAISGNVLGNKTELASKRDLKEINGKPGDGPSEMETTHSPEGRQTAARGYRETYAKYRKMSEAVLNGEPIPLGHRETIRKYFELIRPRDAQEPAQPKANP